MKKFKFKLSALLDHRKRKEDDGKRKLADYKKQLQTESDVLSEFEEKLKGCRKDLEIKQSNGLKSHELKIFSNYMISLKEKIHVQSQKVAEYINLVEYQRKTLVDLSKERKAIERLQDNKHIDYLKKVRSDEQKILDELAVMRSGQSGNDKGENYGIVK